MYIANYRHILQDIGLKNFAEMFCICSNEEERSEDNHYGLLLKLHCPCVLFVTCERATTKYTCAKNFFETFDVTKEKSWLNCTFDPQVL